MSDLKDFPHQLNTPIVTEEEIEKTVPVMDPKTKQITFEKITEKIRVETTYHYSKPEAVSCKRGEHKYFIKNPKVWVASCKNCTRNRFINPLKHTLKNGHIILRSSGDVEE